ncbi:DNA helicase RecQ [Porphyromonas circumdentaria]|uniref:DNA helicase RecQ n=1 Tax=Porphyromonas circumdentaria TaxID=29524 RepID=A0A1T4PEQ2_9PORP|nr:DNA helicase RecQ [Porphyromonas circumdentaria]MBB6275698.1 ATP-dependent DNA helicase RecQ [Porphyromonas circumdentaria]SJZ90053.1 ATP-dependent DNA helicase RecQ [Porphyromonas circumdentaria]
MNQELLTQLKDYFGFDTFKSNQQAIITNLLEGKDSFVLMPTGGGKSLCYQLPALISSGTAIIISPLIALMKNQVDAIRSYCKNDSIAHFLNSSLSKAQLEAVRKDISQGLTKLLYVAPESLNKEENTSFLQSIPISLYAIDEAHCISEWGHDFRPEYRKIRPIIEAIGKRPIIALTATATPKVEHDIIKNLNIHGATIFRSSFNRANLFYQVIPKTESIDRDIIKFIFSNPEKSGIIYCMSRNKVTTFAELLQTNGIKALPYHAGMDARERAINQDAFLSEECKVIVATIAFGMGIDKPDVRYVIHYDMPKSLEGYYQETGRAGRDGGEGLCIAYYCTKDMQRLEKFMQNKPVSEQEIGKQLLSETSTFAESAMCRRRLLLHYFGEEYKKDNCGNCDNCTMPKKKIEATELLQSALEVILALKEKCKEDHVINVLRGVTTADIEMFGHDQLECFGQGEETDAEMWENIINQALIAGFIEKGVENYGVLGVTAKGKKFLKKPTKFEIVVVSEEDEELALKEDASGEAADPELFSMMKDLRKNVAAQHKVPTYVVFQDATLKAMATLYPITEEELQNIPGVSAGKASRYGAEFLRLIRQHVEDNEIERPMDFRVRTVANKSKVKISIIQQLDRRIPLEEIAFSNNLDIEELLTEIEQIVYSGTRINIDYIIYELMSDDDVKEVYDFLKSSESEQIDTVSDEFGDVYSLEELRLIRIKFISEQAN